MLFVNTDSLYYTMYIKPSPKYPNKNQIFCFFVELHLSYEKNEKCYVNRYKYFKIHNQIYSNISVTVEAPPGFSELSGSSHMFSILKFNFVCLRKLLYLRHSILQ